MLLPAAYQQITSHGNREQPGVDERQCFKRLRQPQVGEKLHLPSQLEPLLSLRAAQQTCSADLASAHFDNHSRPLLYTRRALNSIRVCANL